MADTVIEVDNVSKYYRLGVIGTGTLRQDLSRWWAMLRGKPDPTLRVDQVQDESRDAGYGRDHIWALKDISFEVKQGEVLGIIGRNGAGKSTILKILSRVTAPTTGECRIQGRIASLLEVGTGFHPELTGRENIFLNGAILGMTKGEIRRKFDEIVAFSEVEKYIDTPVKRYSSGMYVRLAFAVAAHLEPEILIVDEVLAVGDTAFQQKCLGKMGDVAKEGRTVLFVSHNMGAIGTLCTRALVLTNAQKMMDGHVQDAVHYYLESTREKNSSDLALRKVRKGSGKIRFTQCFTGKKGNIDTPIPSGKECVLTIRFKTYNTLVKDISFGAAFYNKSAHIFSVSTLFHDVSYSIIPRDGTIYCTIPRLPLAPGYYEYNLVCRGHREIVDYVENAGTLHVIPGNFFGNEYVIPESQPGALVDHSWVLE